MEFNTSENRKGKKPKFLIVDFVLILRGCKIKTLSLLDLATVRIMTSAKKADVSPGDLVEIIAPFERGINMFGIVLEVETKYMTVYHGELKKNILWNRRVNCKITRL